MSLLSSTQGTPDRVWSLISALLVSGGALDRATAAEWLNPGFVQNGSVVQEKQDAFLQTLGAATSLGAVTADGKTLLLNPSLEAREFPAFCDWVHDRLVNLDSGEKDAVVLETYAWLAVQSLQEGGLSWVHDWTASRFADAADGALPDATDDDGARRINTSKLSTWRRWLLALGLLVPIPFSAQPHPAAESRVALELRRMNFPKGAEIDADRFLDELAVRLPYLDRGRMFTATARRMGHAPTSAKVSPLLSATLRNLHDEGVIELKLRGDAGQVVRLFEDSSHRIQAFHGVVVTGAFA